MKVIATGKLRQTTKLLCVPTWENEKKHYGNLNPKNLRITRLFAEPLSFSLPINLLQMKK